MPVSIRRPRATSFALGASALFACLASGQALAVPGVSFSVGAPIATGGTGGPGPHANAGTAGDFNGDGYADLVIPDANGQGPRLLINLGNGTFQSPGAVIPLGGGMGTGINTVVAADLNGDGLDDLIAGSTQQLWALISQGNGTFTTAWNAAQFQAGQEGATLKDVTGDGKADLGVQLRNGVIVFRGNGDGTFDAGTLTSFPSQTIAGIEFANLDGDGRPDLVIADAFETSSIYTYLGNGDGTFTQASVTPAPIVPGAVMATDYDGDGIDDITVLAEFAAMQNVLVYKSDGAGAFVGQPARYNGGYFTGNADTADLNGDLIPDIVVPDVTVNKVHVLLGDSQGVLVSGGSYDVPMYSPMTPAFGDYDHDGRLDIAVSGTASAYDQNTVAAVLRNTAP